MHIRIRTESNYSKNPDPNFGRFRNLLKPFYHFSQINAGVKKIQSFLSAPDPQLMFKTFELGIKKVCFLFDYFNNSFSF